MSSAFGRAAASPSKTLFFTTLAFVTAMLVHAWNVRRWGAPTVTAAIAVMLFSAAVVWRGFPRVRLPLLVLGAAIAGAGRFDAGISVGNAPGLPPRGMASYQGRLAQEPRATVKGATIVMDRVFVFAEESEDGVEVHGRNNGAPMDGDFVLSLLLPPKAEIGDMLAWRCAVFAPRVGRESPGNSTHRCAPRGQPTVITRGTADHVANTLLRFKEGIRGAVRRLIPEPDASFVLGLLIGDTGGVPREIVDDFRSTGTSHVLAVSGYNVSLVANFAFGFFAFCLLKRRSAAVAVAVSVTFFALLSGAGPPVVRAALMGGVGVAASLVRRRNGGWTPLLLSAALMLAIDPMAIVTDVGFRLSFAAVVGMRAFGKSFERHLWRLPETFGLRGSCAETLSATVATLPIALHDFGTLPIAALPINMLIVPLVPFATAAGAATLLFGALWTPLGLPLALVTTVATRAMRFFAATGAAVAPAAQVPVTTGESLVMTAFLFLLWFALDRQERIRKEDGPRSRVIVSRNRQKT